MGSDRIRALDLPQNGRLLTIAKSVESAMKAGKSAYHHGRGTPPKRLFWVAVPSGRWRIDWPRTNRGA
jgi:hypothetical protein